MKRSRSARTVAVLACGLSVAVAGLVGSDAGADPVTHRQTFDVAIGYECAFPAGPGPATVRVTASAPVRARAGQSIQFTDAMLTLTMPPAVVTDVGAITVGATTDLEVEAGGEPTGWVGTSPDYPVAEGELVLAVPIQVPEVTGTKAGDLAFTATDLSVVLAPKLGDGTPTDPALVPLRCTPTQDALIGSIAVTGGSTPAPEAPSEDPVVPEDPGFAPEAVALGPVPPECFKLTLPPGLPPPGYTLGAPLCAYLTGFANVAKLNAAVLQPPGIVNLAATNYKFNCPIPRWACQLAWVEPSFEGKPQLPPAPSSFLPFDFVPTTGKMQLTQVGLTSVELEAKITQPYEGEAVATGKMIARVFDVAVNGVPLDVGDNCQTSVPIDIVLTAKYPTYSVTEGGVLDGVVTIPPFSGCGTTEDLDPVISGMVSGPGNYVKMFQGNVCTITTGFRCPPAIPEPKR